MARASNERIISTFTKFGDSCDTPNNTNLKIEGKLKMKYKITICRETLFDIIIDAEDEDTAIELAEGYFDSDRHLFAAIDEIFEVSNTEIIEE